MRNPKASTWLSVLIVLLCVPLGMLLFPESLRVLEERVTAVISSDADDADTVQLSQEARPEEVVQVPTAVEFVQEPDEPQPIADAIPTLPAAEPGVEPARVIDIMADTALVEEALPAPELDLDWTDTSPIADLPELLNPDGQPRELTEDEEREVRRGYRAALAKLRTARSRK